MNPAENAGVRSLTALLFERPWLLGTLCSAVCFILLVLWRRTGSPGQRRTLLVATAVSAILLVAQALVATEREQATALMYELAEAMKRPDPERIAQSIDNDYWDGTCDHDAILALINDALASSVFRRISLSAFAFDRTNGDATISFRVICDVRRGDTFDMNVIRRFEVKLVRRDGRWMVRSARALP